jgi:molybdate transport system regulatory protein
MDKRLKIRITHGPNTAIGPGKADLLEAIIQQGSISKAAQSMNMSYRRAWELVNVMNEAFKSPLVSTAHGGSHGGGAQLTDLGKTVLQHYRDLEHKVRQTAHEELNSIYKQLK